MYINFKTYLNEAFEPGQEPIPDVDLKKLKNIFIEVRTKKEFEKISKWFYKHNFKWDMYSYSPTINYAPWEEENNLVLRIHDIVMNKGSVNFNNLSGYKSDGYKLIKNKTFFSVNDFINIAKYDDRINSTRGKNELSSIYE